MNINIKDLLSSLFFGWRLFLTKFVVAIQRFWKTPTDSGTGNKLHFVEPNGTDFPLPPPIFAEEVPINTATNVPTYSVFHYDPPPTDAKAKRKHIQKHFIDTLESTPTQDYNAIWCYHGLGSSPKSLLYQLEMIGRVFRSAPTVLFQRIRFFIQHRKLPNQMVVGYCGMAPMMWAVFDLGIMDACHAPLASGSQVLANGNLRTQLFANIIEKPSGTFQTTLTGTANAAASSSTSIKGIVLGGMIQTFIPYLALTRAEIPVLTWIRDLFFPQLGEDVIVLLEHKDLEPADIAAGIVAKLVAWASFFHPHLAAVISSLPTNPTIQQIPPPYTNSFALVVLKLLIDRGFIRKPAAILIGKPTVLARLPDESRVATFIDELFNSSIPVIKDLDIGHITPNTPIAFGKSKIEISGSTISVSNCEENEGKFVRLVVNPLIEQSIMVLLTLIIAVWSLHTLVNLMILFKAAFLLLTVLPLTLIVGAIAPKAILNWNAIPINIKKFGILMGGLAFLLLFFSTSYSYTFMITAGCAALLYANLTLFGTHSDPRIAILKDAFILGVMGTVAMIFYSIIPQPNDSLKDALLFFISILIEMVIMLLAILNSFNKCSVVYRFCRFIFSYL